MYRGSLPQTFPRYPNLKTLLAENKRIGSATMVRKTPPFAPIRDATERLAVILRSGRFLGLLRDKFSAVPRSLKDQSSSVLEVWARQCECVFAQRLRRGQQMFSLYTKIWEDRALKEFLKQLRHRIAIRGRDFFVSALGVAAYDWHTNRIGDAEIREHAHELEYVHTLKEKTVCGKCNKGSKTCPCKKKGDNVEKPIVSAYDDWKVFIEKSDLIVWRRPHSSGCYEYKVYGSYPDVSAEDFFNVQIDVNYRKQWDKTAAVLNVVEKDPDPTSHSDIVYWEMNWPMVFANRDYVFNRRYLIDHKSKTLYLVSRSTKHPSCPKAKTKVRIENYYSYMVIRPYSDLNKPGIEFSLTYFDNPGMNVSASMTTWVALHAMPEFLERLRQASKAYKKYCFESGVCQMCNIMDSSDGNGLQYDNRLQYSWDYFDDDITDNTIYEAHYRMKGVSNVTPTKSPPPPPPDGSADAIGAPPTRDAPIEIDSSWTEAATVDEEDAESAEGPANASKGHSFWRYLHPTYYFS